MFRNLPNFLYLKFFPTLKKLLQHSCKKKLAINILTIMTFYLQIKINTISLNLRSSYFRLIERSKLWRYNFEGRDLQKWQVWLGIVRVIVLKLWASPHKIYDYNWYDNILFCLSFDFSSAFLKLPVKQFSSKLITVIFRQLSSVLAIRFENL